MTRAEYRRAEYRSTAAGRERGYVLLGLLLAVSVLMIAAAVVAPDLAFQIKRDREEELVHRGVQYTRAIRGYAKRTGRYPVRAEELLGGPDQRFIRKLYKDPMTGGDFKFLHLDDVQPVAANLNSSNARAGADDDGSASAGSTAATSDDTTLNSADGAGQSSPRPNALARSGTVLAASSAAAGGSQPGKLIFGVVSRSKSRSIREFDHKDHYNDWLFYYDPRSDRGYEIKGPTSLTPQVFPVHTPGQTQPGGSSQQLFQRPPQQPPQQDAPPSQ